MQLLRNVTIGVVLLVAASGLATTKVTHSQAKPQLVNGAPSVDALLDDLLAALAAQDEQGMHRLRVSETEYREIIIPGTVKEGDPPRQVAAMPSEFFWRMLDQKSEDVGRLLMQRFGGHRYTRKELSYTKGVRKFAWYTALGEVRLHVQDENGGDHVLHTGSIAEVNGRYKFIGFNYND